MFWSSRNNNLKMGKGFDLLLCFQDENGDRVYPDVYLEDTLELKNYPILPRVNDTINVDIGLAGLEPFKLSQEDISYEEEWDWYDSFLKKFESTLFKVSKVQLDYYNPDGSAILFLEGKSR